VILSGTLSIEFHPIIKMDGVLMQRAGMVINFADPARARVKVKLSPAYTPQLSARQKSAIADLLCEVSDSLQKQLATVSGSRYPAQELKTLAVAAIQKWKKS
jgi:hypothetical protein